MNKYRCPQCKQILRRRSKKQWIKSYCTAVGISTRIILVK